MSIVYLDLAREIPWKLACEILWVVKMTVLFAAALSKVASTSRELSTSSAEVAWCKHHMMQIRAST